MRAVVVTSVKSSIVATDHPIPTPTADQVLVKVHYAGFNPTDWKGVKYFSHPKSVVGMDFSGEVVTIGSKVTKYKVGDKIAGLVHGGNTSGEGSFAEYLVADVGLTFPCDDLKLADAATFGVSAGTAAHALFNTLEIPAPYEKSRDVEPFVLIWGASSGAGLFAVQLAKAANLRPVTTSSPSSFEMLKALGAEECFDYKDPEAVAKIQKFCGGKLVFGLDCVSTPETVKLSSAAMTGGTMVLLLGDAVGKPENNEKVKLATIMYYTATGKAFNKFGMDFPAIPNDYKKASEFWTIVPRLIKEGKLKSPNVTMVGDDLESYQKGFEKMEKGLVRAEKLCIKIIKE